MSKAQHLVCVRVKVRAERVLGAGVELEGSFEKKKHRVKKNMAESPGVRICVSYRVGIQTETA